METRRADEVVQAASLYLAGKTQAGSLWYFTPSALIDR
ncbi:MAG: hypothetical protein QOG23_3861 [Blastocatellia bacterium]|jgi:hypothetical protein|nr:hypothetical protein [Blastocatellia bacterium]